MALTNNEIARMSKRRMSVSFDKLHPLGMFGADLLLREHRLTVRSFQAPRFRDVVNGPCEDQAFELLNASAVRMRTR